MVRRQIDAKCTAGIFHRDTPWKQTNPLRTPRDKMAVPEDANAGMESFFATLKKEKLYRINTKRIPMKQVKSIIFRYIMVYYNRQRIYTSNPSRVAAGRLSTADVARASMNLFNF